MCIFKARPRQRVVGVKRGTPNLRSTPCVELRTHDQGCACNMGGVEASGHTCVVIRRVTNAHFADDLKYLSHLSGVERVRRSCWKRYGTRCHVLLRLYVVAQDGIPRNSYFRPTHLIYHNCASPSANVVPFPSSTHPLVSIHLPFSRITFARQSNTHGVVTACLYLVVKSAVALLC
jgi:hypothetical protein